ncbi:MAG: hypothetical protein ACUVS5_11905 [Anaerolineae bacterium]
MRAARDRLSLAWTACLLLGLLGGCQPSPSPVAPAVPSPPLLEPSVIPTASPSTLVPEPSPSEGEARARELLVAYYTALGARRWDEAYALLSHAAQEEVSRQAFQDEHSDLVEVGLQSLALRRAGADETELGARVILLRNAGKTLVEEKREEVWVAAREAGGWSLRPRGETLLARTERDLEPPLQVLEKFYAALQQHRYREAYALGTRGFRASTSFADFVQEYTPVVEISLEHVKVKEEGPAEMKVYCRVRSKRVEGSDLVTRLWGIVWTLRLEAGAWRLHEADAREMAKWNEPVAWLEVPVVQFYAALDRGDLEAAYGLLYEGRQALLPLEEFREQYGRYRAVKMYKFRTLEVAALEARVLVGLEVEESRDDGTTATFQYEVEWSLRRVGNSWRLDQSKVVSERR